MQRGQESTLHTHFFILSQHSKACQAPETFNSLLEA
jgi:hypothetical protein